MKREGGSGVGGTEQGEREWERSEEGSMEGGREAGGGGNEMRVARNY